MRALVEGVKMGLTSRKFWRVASVWLVCLLYVLFQGGKTSLMLFMMVSVLGFYWAIGGLGGVKRIRGSRTLSLSGERGAVLQAGDQVMVKLQLQLPAFLPLPYIVVRETLRRHNGDTWVFEDSVVPYFSSRSELVYKTPPLERGKYGFTGTHCSAEDIFGLVEHTSAFHTGGEFRILPRTVFIPHWELYSRNSRLAGPETAVALSRRESTQINGVRDYVYGDRISRIHWSATAKTGTWKSKEFEHESLPKMLLVLDAHTSGYLRSAQFELAVSTAASLLEYGARERISMGLCTLGKTLRYFPPAESYLERQQMLHQLVDINADGFGNYKDRLEAQQDLFQPGAFFILISPLADDKVLSMLRLAKSRQMIPYHIQIGDESAASGVPNAYRAGKRSAWQGTLQERGLRGVYVSSLRELPAAMGGAKL
ncbi:DUF58 domain-containing protein [Paenibacillus rubinfantis]|uniref:DUF58 domain-containing protein n=1 Tax=Paenibacillus rubinfantis TaxID=1720296 RepID=UPI00073EA326|nr:DUF58 domain-containing protein [Paenibacillus rubinfantis]